MIEQRLSEPVLPVRDRASLYDKGWIVATDGDIRLSAPNGVADQGQRVHVRPV
jgi:hypothetical protein